MRFNTKIIQTGEGYGRNDCLVNDGGPMIEFYDPRYQHTPNGQFVARYNVSTLLEREFVGGLCLACDVPEWTVSANDMAEIREWLCNVKVAA